MDIVYKKPSAYKSGAIVKKYKKIGGEYMEDNKPKNLKKWFKEDWIDLADINQYRVLRPTKNQRKGTIKGHTGGKIKISNNCFFFESAPKCPPKLR